MEGLNHGIELTTYFYVWFIGIPVLLANLVSLFRLLQWWPGKARKGSRLSDVMAFQIVAFICLTYMAGVGTVAWFHLYGPWDMSSLTADHYLGHEQFVIDHLLVPMFCYQFWNVILCFVLNDLHEIVMIGHHTVTLGLAYVCMHPCLEYFVCFYFGLAEVTNIPLTIYDTLKYFPEIRKQHENLNELCKYLFVGGFYCIRIFYWTPITFYMIRDDLYPLLANGTAHSAPVVGFFLFAAAFLTGLQWLWAYKIFWVVVGDKFTDKAAKAKTKKEG